LEARGGGGEKDGETRKLEVGGCSCSWRCSTSMLQQQSSEHSLASFAPRAAAAPLLQQSMPPVRRTSPRGGPQRRAHAASAHPYGAAGWIQLVLNVAFACSLSRQRQTQRQAWRRRLRRGAAPPMGTSRPCRTPSAADPDSGTWAPRPDLQRRAPAPALRSPLSTALLAAMRLGHVREQPRMPSRALVLAATARRRQRTRPKCSLNDRRPAARAPSRCGESSRSCDYSQRWEQTHTLCARLRRQKSPKTEQGRRRVRSSRGAAVPGGAAPTRQPPRQRRELGLRSTPHRVPEQTQPATAPAPRRHRCRAQPPLPRGCDLPQRSEE